MFTASAAPDLLNLGSETRRTRRPLSRVKRRKTAESVGATTRGGNSGTAADAVRVRAAANTARSNRGDFRERMAGNWHEKRAAPSG